MSDSQGYDPYVHDPHGAVGAYVADALDDDERTVFEQHLAGCESCRREVAEFTETAAELTWLSEATPPPSLRTSVLWQIATVRPLPPEQPLDAPGSPASPGWWASTEAAVTPRSSASGPPALDPEVTVDRRQLLVERPNRHESGQSDSQRHEDPEETSLRRPVIGLSAGVEVSGYVLGRLHPEPDGEPEEDENRGNREDERGSLARWVPMRLCRGRHVVTLTTAACYPTAAIDRQNRSY